MSSKKLSEEMKLHLINFHGWLHFLSIAMTETGFAGISLLDNVLPSWVHYPKETGFAARL